jgi:hypothetical protein
MKRYLLAALCVALFYAVPAFAQVAAPVAEPTNIVDFGPILTTVIGVLSAVVLAVVNWLGGVAIAFVRSKTKLVSSQMAESAQARFNEAAKRSMAYAEGWAKDKIGGGKVEIDNAWIRTAAEYFKEFWPDLVKGMDLDQIGKTIVARLPSGPMTVAADAQANKVAPVVIVPEAPPAKT